MREFDDLLKSLLVERFQPPPGRARYTTVAADSTSELLRQLDEERADTTDSEEAGS